MEEPCIKHALEIKNLQAEYQEYPLFRFILHNNIDKIDYLKVDCEGAEYSIFESIPFDFLKDNVKKVAIEFHHQIKDKKVQTLINKLKNCNFTLKIVYEENSNIGLIYGKK